MKLAGTAQQNLLLCAMSHKHNLASASVLAHTRGIIHARLHDLIYQLIIKHTTRKGLVKYFKFVNGKIHYIKSKNMIVHSSTHLKCWCPKIYNVTSIRIFKTRSQEVIVLTVGQSLLPEIHHNNNPNVLELFLHWFVHWKFTTSNTCHEKTYEKLGDLWLEQ